MSHSYRTINQKLFQYIYRYGLLYTLQEKNYATAIILLKMLKNYRHI